MSPSDWAQSPALHQRTSTNECKASVETVSGHVQPERRPLGVAATSREGGSRPANNRPEGEPPAPPPNGTAIARAARPEPGPAGPRRVVARLQSQARRPVRRRWRPRRRAAPGRQRRRLSAGHEETQASASGWSLPWAVLIWLGTGFFIVNEGQQAVITQFGRYKATVGAGFNWRLPYPIQRHELSSRRRSGRSTSAAIPSCAPQACANRPC